MSVHFQLFLVKQALPPPPHGNHPSLQGHTAITLDPFLTFLHTVAPLVSDRLVGCLEETR